MVKVAGLWELGWNSPLQESYLWDFPLREYGVEDWRMAPISGIKNNSHLTVKLTEYKTTHEMIRSLPDDYVKVFVDERGEIPLKEFEHPDKAVYIFGKVGESAMKNKNMKEEDISIVVETVHGRGVMWPHQCLVTVLHDRLIKNVR